MHVLKNYVFRYSEHKWYDLVMLIMLIWHWTCQNQSMHYKKLSWCCIILHNYYSSAKITYLWTFKRGKKLAYYHESRASKLKLCETSLCQCWLWWQRLIIIESVESSEKLWIPENNVKRGSVTKCGNLDDIFLVLFGIYFKLFSNDKF